MFLRKFYMYKKYTSHASLKTLIMFLDLLYYYIHKVVMTSHTINADDSVLLLLQDKCKDIFPEFYNLRMYTNI